MRPSGHRAEHHLTAESIARLALTPPRGPSDHPLSLLYAVYLNITKTSLDIFNCSAVASQSGVVVDDTRYLSADPSIPCYKPGSVQVSQSMHSAR
jgi:hypothetical protein